MQILGWVTVGFTYFLMVWGNLVSSTGSGLACPDWPSCQGTVIPPMSKPVVLEWGHRLLALCATGLIVFTLYQVFKASKKENASLKKSGKSLLVLLGLQIVLGGTTVLLGLSPWVSTIHLMIATFVFSGLITVACVLTWKNPVAPSPSKKVGRLAVAGLIGMMIQVCLGGLVRHTHSGLACPNFPGCISSFFPIPFTFETALAFFHRWWGMLMIGVFVHLTMATHKNTPALARVARSALGLSIAQILLGVGTVMSRLNTESRATHAAVGYALWGILFYIAIRSGRIRWLWENTKTA